MHLPFVSRRRHLRTLDAAVRATQDFANLLLRAERERAHQFQRAAWAANTRVLRVTDSFHGWRKRAEQAEVCLAGVLTAAEGGTSPEVAAKKGDYGWSLAYARVLELRQAFDLLAGREHGAGLDPASVLAGGKLPSVPEVHFQQVGLRAWRVTFDPSEVTFLRNVVRQRAWPRGGDEAVVAGIARKLGIEVTS